jgi:electron-transferring-flavoprotein dehydrogenase
MEPSGLNELLPNWKELGAPLRVPAREDHFYYLTKTGKIPLPVPPVLHNDGNYIVSLGEVTRWLGEQAASLGVEIYPGFAGAEVLYHPDGAVRGIATRDVGVGKDGKRKGNFERGVELVGRCTVFAEGCRGSLTKEVTARFDLRKDCQHQTYGIGLKEVWQVEPSRHKEGLIVHTIGWPSDYDTYCGTFMYHGENHTVSIGLVVGLDYENPYLNPYREFQQFKTHPHVRQYLEGGECISYGARAISEGGLQSLPKLSFPGGVLVGDSAGFLNTPKIKGSHAAIKSGILAGDAIVEDVLQGGAKEAASFYKRFRGSWLYDELYQARNVRPAFKFGLLPGLLYSGLDLLVLRGKAPWTLSHHKEDHLCTKPAAECKPIAYPAPDGKLTFDLLTNLTRSGVSHNADQPAHLTLKDPLSPEKVSLAVYDGPEGRFCPAGVYEYVDKEEGQGKGKRLQINAQNCIHCKTCDIKTPDLNVNWVVPEGSGGPAYGKM